MILSHFREYLEEVEIETSGGSVEGQYIDGEWTASAKEPMHDTLYSIPFSKSTLKNLPDGNYSMQDKQFYASGVAEYSKNDVIILNSERFLIRDIDQRKTPDEVTIYYTKKEIEENQGI